MFKRLKCEKHRAAVSSVPVSCLSAVIEGPDLLDRWRMEQVHRGIMAQWLDWEEVIKHQTLFSAQKPGRFEQNQYRVSAEWEQLSTDWSFF